MAPVRRSTWRNRTPATPCTPRTTTRRSTAEAGGSSYGVITVHPSGVAPIANVDIGVPGPSTGACTFQYGFESSSHSSMPFRGPAAQSGMWAIWKMPTFSTPSRSVHGSSPCWSLPTSESTPATPATAVTVATSSAPMTSTNTRPDGPLRCHQGVRRWSGIGGRSASPRASVGSVIAPTFAHRGRRRRPHPGPA